MARSMLFLIPRGVVFLHLAIVPQHTLPYGGGFQKAATVGLVRGSWIGAWACLTVKRLDGCILMLDVYRGGWPVGVGGESMYSRRRA
jgi:hypothetical protein